MRIGVDVGGTFTDFVVLDRAAGSLASFKVLSTPDEPERAVIDGLGQVAGSAQAAIIHGSTVATNALLERRGARTAFVTTRGFRDLLHLARPDRAALYDLAPSRPAPLVPRELCFEVDERLVADGAVIRPLRRASVSELVRRLRRARAESVAVCLLFAYIDPRHERQVGDALRRAGFRVSLSTEILPEFREYERASTTSVNAYLSPRIDEYLERLQRALPEARLRFMQSNGGSLSAAQAVGQAARSVLSGPAGGVIGARAIARLCQVSPALSLDMGGTSTDVSLLRADPGWTTRAAIDGLPIALPMVDVHTIGAGGGSLAAVDAGGALRVGPRSAGADPGPAAYGRGGTQPTVTDANFVLGRLPPDTFTAGGLRPDPEAAARALDRLAEQAGLVPPPGLDPAAAAALGVIEVVNAHMARACRVVSLERGQDPADLTLIAFGGAAGLHAADLARQLGIRRVILPRFASALSALGMLAADVIKDSSQTVLGGELSLEALQAIARRMAEQATVEISREGVSSAVITHQASLDMRYSGQSYELNVPLQADFRPLFDGQHQAAFGHNDPAWPVEVVNVRVRSTAALEPLEFPESPGVGAARPRDRRPALLDGVWRQVPLWHADDLGAGARISGPAIVGMADATVWLGGADEAEWDRWGNVHLGVG